MTAAERAAFVRELAAKFAHINTVLYVDGDNGGRAVRVSDVLLAEAAELEASS